MYRSICVAAIPSNATLRVEQKKLTSRTFCSYSRNERLEIYLQNIG